MNKKRKRLIKIYTYFLKFKKKFKNYIKFKFNLKIST